MGYFNDCQFTGDWFDRVCEMSDLMLHGILNAPCEPGDIIGVTQLKDAAKRASVELKNKEQEIAELREALRYLVKTSEVTEEQVQELLNCSDVGESEALCMARKLLNKLGQK